MKLIFIGPQGSGKGTQAKIISEKLGVEHISTGDLLRNVRGELKKEIEIYTNKGELVPDELVLKILKEKLNMPLCKKGFILDGFPRNKKQSEMLKQITDIDRIIEIKISDEEAIKRIVGRRNCPQCGRIYNLYKFPKPKKENFCDDCGVELFRREDDNEGAIKNRLEIYHRETEPILEEFPSTSVDGEKNIREVENKILEKIKICSNSRQKRKNLNTLYV